MQWYGVHSGIVNNNGTHSGCFNTGRLTHAGQLGGTSGTGTDNAPRGIAFNASSSNSLYGSSKTVTPLSRKCMWYIKY